VETSTVHNAVFSLSFKKKKELQMQMLENSAQPVCIAILNY